LKPKQVIYWPNFLTRRRRRRRRSVYRTQPHDCILL